MSRMRNMLQLFSCIALSLLVPACSSGGKNPSGVLPPPTEEEVMAIYGLYLRGDYKGYVSAMHSADGKPEDYRRQMADLYKQHARAMETSGGGKTCKAVVGRVEQSDSGRFANVFLNVTYADSVVEEIMLPMVNVGGQWRLR